MMIAKLLRQDPALRSASTCLITGPILMTTVLGLITYDAAKEAAKAQLPPESLNISSFATWAGLFWIAILPYLFSGGVRQRSTRLAMSLPISTRSVWLTHIVAVLIGVAAVFAVSMGLVSFLQWLLTTVFRGRDVLQPDIIRLSAFLGAGTVLAVVLLQLPRPKLQKIPLDVRYFLYATLILLFTLGMTLYLGTLPMYSALIPLSAAFIVGWWAHRSFPDTYALIPREAEAPPRHAQREETARPSSGASFLRFLHWTVWRCLYGRWLQYLWLTAPVLIGLGVLLAGVTWTDASDLYYFRFALVSIAVYVLLAFSGLPLRNLYRVESLPIARRPVFFAILVPNLLFLSLGYGVAKIAGAMAKPRENLAYRLDPDDHHYLYVPVRIDEIAWDGHVPQNSSPWGESHEAWSTPMCAGCRARIYSPFHTPIGSSLNFVALQISRASGALYGEAIAPEVIKDRYLDVDEEGKVVLKGEALTLRSDFPHLELKSMGPLFPVMFMLVSVPFALVVAAYLGSFRATVSDGMRKALLFGMLFVIFAFYIAPFVLFVTDFTEDWIVTGTIEILVRNVTDGFAGGAAGIWVICGLAVVAAYLFAESRFRRIEVPPQPKLKAIEELLIN